MAVRLGIKPKSCSCKRHNLARWQSGDCSCGCVENMVSRRYGILNKGQATARCSSVKKSVDFFLKIAEIWWDRLSLNLKITDFQNSNLKISTKNLEKICKKIRSNSKNIGGEFFFQIPTILLDKIQIESKI
jgi:hypothetical protein